ncbi:DUF2793 domain-containing protein [Tabrizicola caldifontis]|uniref:DUF2793 domain-containing protein n=1 Tax=Tabrizicola caldifontis TaxID=2528036 RepID=UPI0010818AD3|nr:DUF2793 domain-containing protein [Rhodobacter sp. YIM 73028]
MPDDTTILSLPLILPAQAQKHVTHNEALLALDLIVQLAVIDRVRTVPPQLPSVGDRHIVAAGASGDWAGQAGRIALYSETGWQFTQPLPGWRAHVLAEGQTAVFDGLVWKAPSDGPLTVTQLGVAATADAVNRLAVSAPATLLNHAGSGHQLKVNKAAEGDTCSLLFQTAFSGRAEMGTAGSDDFSVKVSLDGSAWATALTADAASGEVTLPQPLHLGGQAVDPASPPDGTLWLNTSTGEVKVRSAGVTLPVAVGGGGIADGDKGDITVSGSGTVWTIDAGAVGLSKLAGIPADSFLGRASAGQGEPEVLTPVQARSILNIADGATANASDAALRDRATHTGTQPASSITGLAAVATSGSASDLATGILPAGRFNDTAHGNRAGGSLHATATTGAAGFMSAADKAKLDGVATGANNYTHPNHSGDVTSAGDGVTTITANAVTNAKLAEMATGTIKGRFSAGPGDPEDLTGAQATALLDTFTSGTKGLVPASGGGTTNFLRADGTWTAPPGGAGGSPGGSSGAVQWNDGGSFAGAANVRIEGSELSLPAIAPPMAPAPGGVKLFGRSIGGRIMPAFVGASGLDTTISPHFGRNKIGIFLPPGNGGSLTNMGIATAAAGTATAASVGTTNLHSYMRRHEWLVTTASTTAVAGVRANALQWGLGGTAAGLGGFHLVWRWGPATGVANGAHRAFVGMRGSVSAPSDVDPSTLTNMCGMGYDSSDVTIQFLHNDATGTTTKIDLGPDFPKPSQDRTAVYEIVLFAPPGPTQILHYAVTDLVSGAEATGAVTTDLPPVTQLLAPWSYISVGGVSSVIGQAVMSLYIETDY